MSDEEKSQDTLDDPTGVPVPQFIEAPSTTGDAYKKSVFPVKKTGKDSVSPIAGASEEQVQVRILYSDGHGDKYAVIDDSGQAYLLPKDQLRYSMKKQWISKSYLTNADKPYNMDEEINSLAVTPQQLRVALWESGIVTQEDINALPIRELVGRLLQRGVLPIIKE